MSEPIEFETRMTEIEGKDMRVVEGRHGEESAYFTTCDQGDELFSCFRRGALAAGHTIWDANKAEYLGPEGI